jgi:hypothetical protein
MLLWFQHMLAQPWVKVALQLCPISTLKTYDDPELVGCSNGFDYCQFYLDYFGFLTLIFVRALYNYLCFRMVRNVEYSKYLCIHSRSYLQIL